MLGGCGIFDGAADGVELDLKMLARRPLGPVSSVAGPEGGGPTVTPPRAEEGPA